MSEEQVDLLIVGGGINGAGIARDAAGRGLSVMLVEKDDLAAHTSSASSKLIHGGLRYLEHFEMRLVRESLAEREYLLRAAPHIVRPLRFVIPLTHSARPAWMIRAGLFLYDHLGGRELLGGARPVRLDAGALGEGLRPGNPRAFSYWDCRAQDSRLVILNAIDAAKRGARILVRTELVGARREPKRWVAALKGPAGEEIVHARALVNAAGPFAAALSDRLAGAARRRSIRLIKGSHIVLPRLYPGTHAFLLQNPDRRVVFAIPFEETFTLVGTTDVEWTGPPFFPAISDEEIHYLLATVSRYFRANVSSAEIVWSYSGIRALYDDGTRDPSKVPRDHVLELDDAGAPLLSVFGGKITIYRRLAEKALGRLADALPEAGEAWTRDAVLPGGDIADLDLDRYASELVQRHCELPARMVQRLARTYGTRAEQMLKDARSVIDLGEHFGAGLYAREVDYLVGNEWARTAQDVLFRRTKLGLHMGPEGTDRLTAYLGSG